MKIRPVGAQFHAGGQTEGPTDGRTDGRTDGQTGGGTEGRDVANSRFR